MSDYESLFEWEDVNDEFPGLNQDIYAYTNQFNYCLWTPNTHIKLCNVPWDGEYRDVVRFKDIEARDAYFASLDSYEITLNGYVYLRKGEPVRIQLPFGEALNYNYLCVYNPMQPVPHYQDHTNYDCEYFFYFIRDINYIAPNTTELVLQLDVWQSYIYRCHIGRGFLERGHASIANGNLTDYNVDAYLLEPEGLQQGNEYQTIDIEQFRWIDWTKYLEYIEEAEHEGEFVNPIMVIISSAAKLGTNYGTMDSPNLVTADGDIADGIPEGSEIYLMELNSFQAFMTSISQYPWISQCINFISILPTNIIPDLEEIRKHPENLGNNIKAYRITELMFNHKNDVSFWKVDNWREKFDAYIPDEYSDLRKFKTSPYAIIEATTLTGGEIIMKPECLQNEDVDGIGTKDDITFIYDTVLTPPNMRTVIYPACYNGNMVAGHRTLDEIPWESFQGKMIESPRMSLYGGENMDLSLTVSNWPQCSLVNNSYLYYMASTVNTRNYLFDSADWSQDKANYASEVAKKQAYFNANMYSLNQLGSRMYGYSMLGANARYNADMQRAYASNLSALQNNNEFNGVMRGVSGALTAAGTAVGLAGLGTGQLEVAAVGAGIGAIGSGVGTAQSFFSNENQLNASNALSIGALDAASAQNASNISANTALNSLNYGIESERARYAGDTNYDLAQYAMKGDYELAQQAIQARCEDARLKQPTTSGQNMGDTFNISREFAGLYVKFKMPKMHYVRQIGDFWLRYGCAVNRWVEAPQDLSLMKHYTYWKYTYCPIKANIPTIYRDALRGVMEKGVTVWRQPDEIMDVPLYDNAVTEDWGY